MIATQDVLTLVIQAILIPLLPIVGRYAIDFLRAHAGEKTTNIIIQEARSAAQAAEQMAASGQISKESKLWTALELMKNVYPKESNLALQGYIESAVHEMRTWGPQTGLLSTGVVDAEPVAPFTPTDSSSESGMNKPSPVSSPIPTI